MFNCKQHGDHQTAIDDRLAPLSSPSVNSVVKLWPISLAAVTLVGLAYALWGAALVTPLETMLSRPAYMTVLRLVHVVVFGAWTFAWLRVWRARFRRLWDLSHTAIPIAVAILSEVVQRWLPGHSPNLDGALASVAGVAVGVVLVCRASAGTREAAVVSLCEEQ